tara:strand:- start:48581 stop:48685 length:105 start_codon:yes stop_codon:yes gene_type:complete
VLYQIPLTTKVMFVVVVVLSIQKRFPWQNDTKVW